MRKRLLAVIAAASLAAAPAISGTAFAAEPYESTEEAVSSDSSEDLSSGTAGEDAAGSDETQNADGSAPETGADEILRDEPEETSDEQTDLAAQSGERSAVFNIAADGKSVEIIYSDAEAAALADASMQFGIWSENGGLDDFRWEQAEKQSDGTFKKTIYAGDYKGYGSFSCHVYMKQGSDLSFRYGDVFNINKPEKKVSYVLSADEKTVTAAAEGADPAASGVRFALWSEEGGQDDITWTAGKKQQNGDWTAQIPVKGHKSTGRYYLHAYQMVGSVQSFAGGREDITITGPEAEIVVENEDNTKGTFSVRAKNINAPSGVTSIKAGIWGARNGQNDIAWHEMTADGSDYVCEVSAGQHKYEKGQYMIHCYLTDGNGITGFAGATETDVDYEQRFDAVLSADEKTLELNAVGVVNANAVRFGIWSDANGQDDLRWAEGVRQAGGEYKASVNMSGFKHTGSFTIHAYQLAGNKISFFRGAAVTLSAPSAKVTVENVDEEKGSFDVRISDISSKSGISKVSIGVWGDKKGADDLMWHEAVASGSDYVATVLGSDHHFETGNYNCHCYITDGNGIQSFAGAETGTMKIKNGIKAIVDANEMNANVAYVGENSGKMRAAVWSDAGGQDDVVWYDMVNYNNGAVIKVPITNHKTAGKYNVHVYSGSNYVTGTTFNISSLSASSAAVSDVNGHTGKFRVNVDGVDSKSGVSSVKIAAWPKNDAGAMAWYTAKKSGNTYYADVNVANHKRKFGDYNIHVYAYGNNGVGECVKAASTHIDADKYVYAASTGTYTAKVWLAGAGSDTSSAKFGVWSDTNGQDDCVWYTAKKSGNDWYADVDSAKHKSAGSYQAHCYIASSSGSSVFAGATSFNLQKKSPNSNQQMYDMAQGFSSDTQYLILINRAIHRVAIYQGSRGNWTEIRYWPCVVGKPSTPTPAGTFKIKGRFDWFGEGHKCWWATQIEGYYYFHTQIYYWDDAPRRILDGTMDAAASMGCVRLYEPNARWIYTTIPRGTTVHIF